MHALAHRHRGFTLIELLVVVAIIALLIAVILPQLARAKEQGRIAVCISNQRSLTLAATMYRQEDTSKDLPWAVPFGYKVADHQLEFNITYASEFIWGGGMPQKNGIQFALGTGVPSNAVTQMDVYIVPPRFRPMNKYVTPNVSWDGGERDRKVDREKLPMPLPGVFVCPSDKSAWVPDLCNASQNPANIEYDSAYSTWDHWGTSYAINWYWSIFYFKLPQGQGPPPECNRAARALGLYHPGYKGQGASMMNRNAAGGWESKFVVFYENLFNYAAQGARPQGLTNAQAKLYRGWHGQPNYHAAGYLDGHADYRYRDTRYVEGTGWTTWPNRPYTGWNAP